ncbi:hypothetical protein Taro_019162 [Colocasia esculenta]|uniref:Uncharacterized protein n=1 Tax=Colocasia esculenta TaxID=4460 RepID=A0A843UVX6_COLES|nr:hypothetical protein [Colocasia esculenta]
MFEPPRGSPARKAFPKGSEQPNGHQSHNSSRYARASRRLFRHDPPNVTHVGLDTDAYKGTGTVPCNGTFSSSREHILAFRNPLPHKLSTDLGIGGFPRSSPGLLILFWFCRPYQARLPWTVRAPERRAPERRAPPTPRPHSRAADQQRAQWAGDQRDRGRLRRRWRKHSKPTRLRKASACRRQASDCSAGPISCQSRTSSSSPAIVFPLSFQWRPVWLRSKQDHTTTTTIIFFLVKSLKKFVPTTSTSCYMHINNILKCLRHQ